MQIEINVIERSKGFTFIFVAKKKIKWGTFK